MTDITREIIKNGDEDSIFLYANEFVNIWAITNEIDNFECIRITTWEETCGEYYYIPLNKEFNIVDQKELPEMSKNEALKLINENGGLEYIIDELQDTYTYLIEDWKKYSSRDFYANKKDIRHVNYSLF